MKSEDELIRAWSEATWEYTLVFDGLPDEDVWKRPHPRLLSIGELTGHVVYWEAIRTAESIPEVAQAPIAGVLVDPIFRYYSSQVENPVSLDLSAEQVLAELKRVHEESKAAVMKVDRASDDPIVGQEGWTWGAFLRYRAFHAAYHAGQAYSVRHLLGHATTDN